MARPKLPEQYTERFEFTVTKRVGDLFRKECIDNMTSTSMWLRKFVEKLYPEETPNSVNDNPSRSIGRS